MPQLMGRGGYCLQKISHLETMLLVADRRAVHLIIQLFRYIYFVTLLRNMLCFPEKNRSQTMRANKTVKWDPSTEPPSLSVFKWSCIHAAVFKLFLLTSVCLAFAYCTNWYISVFDCFDFFFYNIWQLSWNDLIDWPHMRAFLEDFGHQGSFWYSERHVIVRARDVSKFWG